MGNRLVLNILGSAGHLDPGPFNRIWPFRSQALSLYGVLTSMAMPFLFFPSAITNSMAVLLLPSAAEAQSRGNKERISSMLALSIRCSCYMGILCIGIFTRFWQYAGNQPVSQPAGRSLYHHPLLALPLYVPCNHAGKHTERPRKNLIHFFQNVAAMILRLLFVLFAIPSFGIRGYL